MKIVIKNKLGHVLKELDTTKNSMEELRGYSEKVQNLCIISLKLSFAQGTTVTQADDVLTNFIQDVIEEQEIILDTEENIFAE